jgi:glutaredoxin
MTLFTKPDCQKCTYVKANLNLEGVQIHELNDTNPDALGQLAWFEAVTLAETTLPILVLDNGDKVTLVKDMTHILGRK